MDPRERNTLFCCTLVLAGFSVAVVLFLNVLLHAVPK